MNLVLAWYLEFVPVGIYGMKYGWVVEIRDLICALSHYFADFDIV
jgi:hypothetical protein